MKVIETMTNEEVYLDYFNDFLTTEKMAEYYGVTERYLIKRIKAGKKIHLRKHNLIPGNIPKWIRCYDLKESADRYTVCFTKKKVNGVFMYLGMSENPFHPQGIGMHGESEFQPIDRPTYSHLGKRITFNELPEKCQELVIQDYKDIWNLN